MHSIEYAQYNYVDILSNILYKLVHIHGYHSLAYITTSVSQFVSISAVLIHSEKYVT